MQYHELPGCACSLTSFKVLEGCQKSFFTYPKPSLLLAKQATIPQPLIVQTAQTHPLPLYGSSVLEHVPLSSRKVRISREASTYIPRGVPSWACRRSTQTNPLEAFPQLPGCNTGLQQHKNRHVQPSCLREQGLPSLYTPPRIFFTTPTLLETFKSTMFHAVSELLRFLFWEDATGEGTESPVRPHRYKGRHGHQIFSEYQGINSRETLWMFQGWKKP